MVVTLLFHIISVTMFIVLLCLSDLNCSNFVNVLSLTKYLSWFTEHDTILSFLLRDASVRPSEAPSTSSALTPAERQMVEPATTPRVEKRKGQSAKAPVKKRAPLRRRHKWRQPAIPPLMPSSFYPQLLVNAQPLNGVKFSLVPGVKFISMHCRIYGLSVLYSS